MKYKICLIFIFTFISISFSQSQIRFSETIQDSKISNPDNHSLYFVDFWATWCGPCVYANEYLQVLQKQYPNEFYIVSLSEENPDKVRRHLEKHPTELAVVIDFDGETFDANTIKTLPYGILINANGKVLWKGDPTDFKSSDLRRYLSSNNVKRSYSDVFEIISTDIKYPKDYVPKDNFEVFEFQETIESLEITKNGDHTHFKGSLKQLLANQLQVLERQISLPDELNRSYNIYSKNGDDILEALTSELDLTISTSHNKADVLVVNNASPNFWDQDQMDWGKDASKFLIDDSQIQADNVSFNELLYQLALVLDLPVVTTTDMPNETLHDWQVHYKFFSLMKNDLLDNYGLEVEKKQAEVVQYNIIKKAP